MDTESNSGKMGLAMKDIGLRTRPMGEVSLSTQMVMYMKEIGLLTKLMVKELTNMPTALAILANGLRTNSTATASKLGQTEQDTKDCTKTARKMGMVP